VPQGGPGVILITVDTLRPDRLSAYGYTQRRTPQIDSLARDGVLFERAVCDVPWTTGSMASVFTGQYAPRHGVRLPTQRLSDRAVTLAEILRERGFRTGAVVGSFPVASIYNLHQGFETYDEDFTAPLDPRRPGEPFVDLQGRPRRIKRVPEILEASPEEMQRYFAEKAANDACRPDSEVTDAAIGWLKQHSAGRFFLWVHYFGPHERVNLLQEWRDQWPRVVADYDDDLAESDRQVGRLLQGVDRLGLRERTLVVLHSDHGQALGEDDYVGHGSNLYGPSLRIPLLVRYPGQVPAGQRVARLARNVDILPTILSLVQIPAPADLDGTDLAQMWRAATPAGDRSVRAYAETLQSTFELHRVDLPEHGELSVRLARFGLLRGERMLVRSELVPPCHRPQGEPLPDDQCARLYLEELFDPFAAGWVRINVADAEAPTASLLAAELRHLRQTTASRPEALELSPADREKLRALGYDS
jgi:arylsulfatase A-like enzyme